MTRNLRLLLIPLVTFIIVFAVAFFATVAMARADGYIDAAEQSYIDAYAAGAICPVLDEYPMFAGVEGVALGIMDDGFSADNAVDIINGAVWQYCPRHWTLLENIGAEARGEAKRMIA